MDSRTKCESSVVLLFLRQVPKLTVNKRRLLFSIS